MDAENYGDILDFEFSDTNPTIQILTPILQFNYSY